MVKHDYFSPTLGNYNTVCSKLPAKCYKKTGDWCSLSNQLICGSIRPNHLCSLKKTLTMLTANLSGFRNILRYFKFEIPQESFD